ncbi:MAG: pyridoxal-phosphate dependent enzyme, partial [Candidatus Eremiobacteraeota bacterium]|nr:pyridoxal-phosphate dependent enzyme [Candidatus Eremiobacteraeota bacterium]
MVAYFVISGAGGEFPRETDTKTRTAVELDDIKRAATAIRGRVRRTNLVESLGFSELIGGKVSLKLENRQLTGSFKDRGAANRMMALSADERAHGVIALSAGNHAQAVAYVAQTLGVPATIVMPSTTPFYKVRRTEGFGAKVVLHGETLSEASERAYAIEKDERLTFIHPYDDARIIAGQGTVGLEIMEAAAELDAIIVPVGGGGLLAGIL